MSRHWEPNLGYRPIFSMDLRPPSEYDMDGERVISVHAVTRDLFESYIFLYKQITPVHQILTLENIYKMRGF